jgi:lipopolysaccharide/colanic/teichoic acid biosynthesis glycosyltransferase
MRSEPGASITARGDTRMTALGRVLRHYKLDELPQLWNVLTGEMSLVGPRPEVPRFVDLQNTSWCKLLTVRPGITDLASVVFRSEEELLGRTADPEQYYEQELLPRKLSLSLCYLAKRSMINDLKIILLTAVASVMPRAVDPDRVKEVFCPPQK